MLHVSGHDLAKENCAFAALTHMRHETHKNAGEPAELGRWGDTGATVCGKIIANAIGKYNYELAPASAAAPTAVEFSTKLAY